MLAARFDDLRSGDGWTFPAPHQTITATVLAEVVPALTAVEHATRHGHWAYGFVCHEAAPALDPAVTVRPHPASGPGAAAAPPLVWFAVTDRPDRTTLADLPTGAPYTIRPPDEHATDELGQGADGPWRWDWTATGHAARVARVRTAIADGRIHQCNLTTRVRARFTGDRTRWYRDLATRQAGSHHALIDTGTHTVVSASPESFFTWQGDRVSVVPMKGTAPRGADGADDDLRARTALLGSAKERAENVMVVDLVRNDLSRIARPGTVRTSRLLDCEAYPTVWQLTSTVTGEVPPGTGLAEVFAALFPCGSVTGAPKPAATALIAELEDRPRGIYCGAVGWVAPPAEPVRARFSVAIRTAVIDNATGQVEYGVGGGITWDSEAAAEFAELRAKARILDDPGPPVGNGFAVIETMAVRDGRIGHAARHRDRLLRSAHAFAIVVDPAQLDAVLAEVAGGDDRIVRLLLRTDGTLAYEARPLPGAASPVRLALDTVATPDSPWRRHKTTRREVFGAARRRHPDADDVVLVNEHGRVTETTIASLAVRVGGVWCTPPVSEGLLPGVGRAAVLDSGHMVERPVTTAELTEAEDLAVVSSVRGWRRAVLTSAG